MREKQRRSADHEVSTVRLKANAAFREIGRELGDRLLAVSKGKIQSSSELHGIEFAAMHDEPLLIVGESGTGKQVIAEEIHRRWMRGVGQTEGQKMNSFNSC